ncbi:hypothetical protein LDI01_16370 [Lentilactobacillus diolivorans]|uniref:Uncharacterized protein n=1 Tax=Lentilactobacillus diolivorans TaxID=179838 RepID=A0ABQ0XEF0_9LACO|nr:hypothetical protein LDI01_16370 [Lentilactobacillus diolivorans]
MIIWTPFISFGNRLTTSRAGLTQSVPNGSNPVTKIFMATALSKDIIVSIPINKAITANKKAPKVSDLVK